MTGLDASAAPRAATMGPSLADAPAFDIAGAARLARELYGREGPARALPSERDQNFLIETADGERIVLKIANAGEDAAMLDAQQRALAHLAARGVGCCPRVGA